MNNLTTLLGEIKNISIDKDIIPEENNKGVIIDIENAKIKEIERTGNYELKLILEDSNGNKGHAYIKAVSDSQDSESQIKGRNILNEIQLCSKIKDVPFCVLPKLSLKFLR